MVKCNLSFNLFVLCDLSINMLKYQADPILKIWLLKNKTSKLSVSIKRNVLHDGKNKEIQKNTHSKCIYLQPSCYISIERWNYIGACSGFAAIMRRNKMINDETSIYVIKQLFVVFYNNNLSWRPNFQFLLHFINLFRSFLLNSRF